MRFARLAAAAAFCVAAGLTIAGNIAPRWQCSIEKNRIELWLEGARQSESIERRMAIARGQIPRLMQCVEHDPSDYETLFLLGVARRDAGQHEAALQAFSSSLALNERPETYLNVALLQFEAGNADEARRNLLRAVYFNLDMIDEVDHAMREEMQSAVVERQNRLRARVR